MGRMDRLVGRLRSDCYSGRMRIGFKVAAVAAVVIVLNVAAIWIGSWVVGL